MILWRCLPPQKTKTRPIKHLLPPAPKTPSPPLATSLAVFRVLFIIISSAPIVIVGLSWQLSGKESSYALHLILTLS